MKIKDFFLIIGLSLILAGCTVKAPQEVELQALEECAIKEVPEGWWCYNIESFASLLLPSEFEAYGGGDPGNFVSPEKNNFIHTGYFPLKIFSPEAQKLLNEGKIQEYMEYEQENICKTTPECPSEIIPSSFAYHELGGKKFFKYDVTLKNAEAPFTSTHYATILNDVFFDFSSSEGEMIPYPQLDGELVKSVKIKDPLFRDILKTLTAK